MTGRKHPHKSPTYSDEDRLKRAEIIRQNVARGKRKFRGPDGTIYNSIGEGAKCLGLSYFMLSKYLHDESNLDYIFIDD